VEVVGSVARCRATYHVMSGYELSCALICLVTARLGRGNSHVHQPMLTRFPQARCLGAKTPNKMGELEWGKDRQCGLHGPLCMSSQ
jgi:hypothetical protein